MDSFAQVNDQKLKKEKSKKNFCDAFYVNLHKDTIIISLTDRTVDYMIWM